MFSCSAFRARAVPRALLLFASFILTVDAAADSGDYRTREETRSGDMRVTQSVDTVAFPHFQGTRPAVSGAVVPSVGADHVRSIRMLIPETSRNTFALALQDASAYMAFDFFNHAVTVEYGGKSVNEAAVPFVKTDRELKWNGSPMRRWMQVIRTGSTTSSGNTHFLVSLYILPRFDSKTPTQGTPNLVVTINRATVHGMNVVRGATVVDNVMLAVSDADWKHWREQAIQAGNLFVSSGEGINLPAGFTGGVPFIEQRAIALNGDSNARRRDKRCMSDIAYEISHLMFPLLLEVYFGRADLCSLDPHPNQDIAAPLPLVEITNRDDVPAYVTSTVYEAVAREPDQLGGTDAFDAAMATQFCNTNNPQANDGTACTDEDLRAAGQIGTLSPAQITELLAHIERMFDPDQPGTATLRTGHAELDRWLNADLERAENALNAAQAVVHVSDVRKNPKEPIKNDNDENRKRPLVKSSCVMTDKHARASDDDGFQVCVRDAKRRLNIRRSVIAVPPLVEHAQERNDAKKDKTRENHGYFRPRTPEFNRILTEFRNSGREMPRGLSQSQLAEFTAAAARDPAPTGDNVGLILFNNPAFRGTVQRFPYGIEHIWAPGGGGGDDAGHRDDWTGFKGFKVERRELMVDVVMTALTDPNAQYTQTRTRKGNIVRTFHYFVFTHNGTMYAIRNVRIVLGQNGMVITAYPLRNASAAPLSM
jgi:hypothetical protein